jgi:polyferredoxin
MFMPTARKHDRAATAAGLLVVVFMVGLFAMMVRTGRTQRWRRIFFVTLGFLFPVGFIWELFALRGSMSLPIERLVAGDTPFCFLAIPMLIIPAAVARTVVFPGAILPSAANPHAVASMVALWMAATLVLGKAWCSYGCFFGGIEEGFAAIARRARIRNIDPRWRWVPWAVLVVVVLMAAATLEPFYCTWLCPFKAVTEFEEVRSLRAVAKTGMFITLFASLVVVLPLLTKRRTQCAFFCPFGVFQSLANKLTVFRVRIDRSRCKDCGLCILECPVMALDKASVLAGETRLSCMRCGACVDSCSRGAALWHIRGTSPEASPETARMLLLYSAWAFATMFGGSIIAGTVSKLLHAVLGGA